MSIIIIVNPRFFVVLAEIELKEILEEVSKAHRAVKEAIGYANTGLFSDGDIRLRKATLALASCTRRAKAKRTEIDRLNRACASCESEQALA